MSIAAQKYTDEEYVNCDPFSGEEGDLTCRTVTIRRAKKRHVCYGLSGQQDHHIEPGQLHRHERARVDRESWGEYRLCFDCLDKFLAGEV